MSNEIQLNGIALTKTGLYTATNNFCNQVADGTMYPAEAIAKGKMLELAGKAIQDTAKAFLKADKDEYNGVTVTQSSRASKDYSNDVYWLDIEQQIKVLKEKQKAHEKLIDTIKTVENPLYFTTPDGEYYKLLPAQVTYTPMITVKIPD
jgi:hypothetical protein